MTAFIREGGKDGETRYEALSKIIGHWIRMIRLGSASLSAAWLAVQQQNAATIQPPWNEKRLRREFEAILRLDIEKNGPMPGHDDDAPSATAPAFSEDALAQVFAREFGRDWHHVIAWGQWLHWSGSVWKKDSVGAVLETARIICREAALKVNKTADKRRLASARTIQAVVKIAATDPMIALDVEALDRHAMLLNTPDGIIDLETGMVGPPERRFHLTQITRANAGKGCPIWIGFLDAITAGNAELAAYLARVAGYCLTGCTREQVFFLLHGSRRKGMWMGGVPPYGYRVESRKLVVDEDSAENVRWIFARFIEIGSCTELAREVGARGIRTQRRNRIDKKYLYRMLSNRAYIGEAVHKGESYPGEHDAIIDREMWDRVHAILTESPRKRAARTRADTPALLKGLLFGPDCAAFSPTHTRKGGRLYRYYVSQTVLKHGAGSCPIGRVPAGEIEAAVIEQLRAVFRQPEIVAGTWKAARIHADGITESDARAAVQQLDPLWDELFPAEQARIVTLLVERIDMRTDGLNVRLRVDGLSGLAREMLSGGIGEAA